MANERKTENLVRDSLRRLGYYDDDDLIVEEQRSDSPVITKLLRSASKKGMGCGLPEFIIRSKTKSDFIIVIECKAENKNHASPELNKYAECAVDGALLYGSFLAKEFDVLAVGVSGQTQQELTISQFVIPRGTTTRTRMFGDAFMPFADYRAGYAKSDIKFSQDYGKLLSYTKGLNERLHTHKIKESQRSLLISGILISLENDAFRLSYHRHNKASQLCDSLIATIQNEFADAGIARDKVDTIVQSFSFVRSNTTLSTDKEAFVALIHDIDGNINGFMKTWRYLDTIGQFYIEFLRYANNDKGLGIVLTPPHITDLFCAIARVDRDSVVLDNCCGTGGFLISAMKQMIKDSRDNAAEIEDIKRRHLIGIEYQDDIYALCISNMILHGDGKTNLIVGDGRTPMDAVRALHPNVGLLNPPFSINKSDTDEFEFVFSNLDMLQKGGTCVAIVPLSCVIATRGDGLTLKQRLLEHHTLEAVMSLPEELFSNSKVTTTTCAVVVTAHIPHPENKKTWLGYWRDDGFVKTKNQGRVDLHLQWNAIRERWLSAFMNREIIANLGLTRKVGPADEWCAEAYMETDYSTVTREAFEMRVKQYLSYRLQHDLVQVELNHTAAGVRRPAGLIPLRRLFTFRNGLSSSRVKVNKRPETPLDVRYIRPSHTYAGSVAGYVDSTTVDDGYLYPDNTIYVSTDGQGSHSYSYLSSFEFVPNSNVTVLLPKEPMTIQEKLFYTACITANRFKFSYGRKPKGDRLKNVLVPAVPADFVYENIFAGIFEKWEEFLKLK